MLQRLPGLECCPKQPERQCQLPRRPSAVDTDCGCTKQEFAQRGHPESRQSSAEHPQGLELEHILKVMLHDLKHHCAIMFSSSSTLSNFLSITTTSMDFQLSRLTHSYLPSLCQPPNLPGTLRSNLIRTYPTTLTSIQHGSATNLT